MVKGGPQPQFAKRKALERLLREGATMSEAARHVGVNRKTAKRWRYGRRIPTPDGRVLHYPPVILLAEPSPSSPRYLSAEERVRIADLRREGRTLREIGALLGRDASTISRELRRNADTAGRYRPHDAHQRAVARRRRQRLSRLAGDVELREWVEGRLQRRWSPEQIARTLPTQFPLHPDRWLCAETIYQAVYRPDLGGLSRELPGRVLRYRRRQRVRRRHPAARRKQEQIIGMTPIGQRPSQVLDRARPGDWEGDLIMGTGNASALVTLVERTSRFTFVGHLPQGRKDAAAVRDVVAGLLAPLPARLRRTLTWDQGKEMSRHHELAAAVPGLKVFFCDAHSPWQRPSNENANGLLRDYLPKGTNLALHTAAEVAEIQDQLNERPRRVLGWKSPTAVFDTLTKPSRVLRR